MTRNIAAARATTAREIGTTLIIGNFNGLPVIDNNLKLIGLVIAIDIFQARRQGKSLDQMRYQQNLVDQHFPKYTENMSFFII